MPDLDVPLATAAAIDGGASSAPEPAPSSSQFGDSVTEVERILANQRNFYTVLQVQKDTPVPEIRANYFKISRLVHPDKCSHPNAAQASAVCNQGYETLKDQGKRKLYDRYIAEVEQSSDEKTYAEWEHDQNKIPEWLIRITNRPGGTTLVLCCSLLLIIILLPIVLVVLILMVVFTIVCMPVQLFLDCCCGQRLYTPPAEEAPKPDNPGTTDQPDTAPNAAENAV